jgi:flagellar basal body rod protein FlgC
MLSAARSYEAGISVIKTVRQLLQATLNLVR